MKWKLRKSIIEFPWKTPGGAAPKKRLLRPASFYIIFRIFDPFYAEFFMPIFEYHCEACDRRFERIIRKPDNEVPCPECGRMANRIVSAPSATPSDNSPACASGACRPRGGFT